MFAVGQKWRYAAPDAVAGSRFVIGAILAFGGDTRIICSTVTNVLQKQPDGSLGIVTIAFLPMTEAALAATVTEPDGDGEVSPNFASQFAAWHEDGRGLSYFTVPFDGSLDRMIARQMAELVQAGPATD